MRITTLLLITFFSSNLILAQYTEVGIQVGLSNYIGDLSEYKLKSESYGSMIGIYGKYNFTKYLSAKASLSKGAISGDDQFAKTLDMQERNLNFRTDILELAVTGEYNLSPYNIRAKQTGVPYVFAGLALAHFNPQAQMQGSWYDLQPLKTEGVKYSRYTVAVPFGIGMKLNISYKVNFGFEFGARKTFTDYLDDVSGEYIDVIAARDENPTVAALAYRTPEITGTFEENPVGTERGNPNNQDWYLFGAVSVSINLTDKYGLDFDPKYDIFKEHLQKPEKVENKVAEPKQKKKDSVKTDKKKTPLFKKQNKDKSEKKKTSSKKKKDKEKTDEKKIRLFKKKEYLKPTVKKRVLTEKTTQEPKN